MKDFVKMVLAVLCALFIVGILSFFLTLGMIGSMAALGSSKTVLPREGVLEINMSDFVLGEQSVDDKMSSFASMNPLSGGSNETTIGLYDAVQAIHAAAADPAVKYIWLRPDGASAGVATAQEFRGALASFRESGKPVIASLNNPSNGGYYLATVADKIYLSSAPGGQSMLLGLSARLMFLKDLLDKLGVNMQLIHHGKYKSAGEMYIRNAASPENLEQNQVMVDGIWKSMCEPMAEARDISVEELNALIDNLSLNFPEDFLEHKLVDELFNRDQLVAKLCELASVEKKEDLHLITFQNYVKAKVFEARPTKAKSVVAVIYAEGDIVEGDGTKGIAGDRFVRVIEKVREDDNVKAVVLRVNSPGGSVSASEKIKVALDSLMAGKPLVASYGNYAASGGYWISANTQRIFAQPGTLTGSIGVFSMLPDFSKTAKNIAHVNMTMVNSNKHSDVMSSMRPLDAAETAYMQASVEDIYTRFVGLVSKGRGLAPERVDEIAQGRVWTGADAIGLGLVDEIGTLEDAIVYAASLAGFTYKEDYKVVGYPKPKDTMASLLEMLGGDNDDEILAGTPFAGMESAIQAVLRGEPGKVYARIPYDIDIR